MRIETDRLILREPTMSDAESIAENINNLKIARWLLSVPYPYTTEDAKWFINHCAENRREKPRKSYNLSIELKDERRVVGGAGLTKVDVGQGTGDIGYWLGEQYWRKGIVTEAAKALIDYAFSELKLRRITIPAYSDNKASNGVAEKLGFTFEGKLRQAAQCKATGKIHDENVLGLLKDEWSKKK